MKIVRRIVDRGLRRGLDEDLSRAARSAEVQQRTARATGLHSGAQTQCESLALALIIEVRSRPWRRRFRMAQLELSSLQPGAGAGLLLSLPFWLYQIVRHGKYWRRISRAHGTSSARRSLTGSRPSDVIWIHAVSVGEVLAVSRPGRADASRPSPNTVSSSRPPPTPDSSSRPQAFRSRERLLFPDGFCFCDSALPAGFAAPKWSCSRKLNSGRNFCAWHMPAERALPW